uniref:Uncharacterized protein n=1 Tax=viral metagenome TaxID=1070528 RepID=A0A6C0J6N3_9ZZZZ
MIKPDDKYDCKSSALADLQLYCKPCQKLDKQ